MMRVIVIAAILLAVSNVFAAELLVPGEYPTIQSAIDAASPNDTVIISPGTYSGEGNYNISFAGKPLTVRSTDPNDWGIIESTVIDCNRLGQGFDIDANVILEGVTVTRAINAGIYSYDFFGAPIVRNCYIHDNNTSGISARSITIIGCNITNNSSNYGGGIFSSTNSTGIIKITDCNISNNTALGYGGGIYNKTGGLIENCKFINNHAVSGGGAYFANGSSNPIIANNLFFADNNATNGGGMYVWGFHISINDCIIIGNYAQNYGGGLYIETSTNASINSCTFVCNEANNLGGGISGLGYLAVHSIFRENKDSTGIITNSQIYPIPTASAHLLLFSCIEDFENKFGGANYGNINDDPLFVREPNDGGDGWGVGDNDDYGDLHLRPESPCINKGNPIYKSTLSDIDGEPRVIGKAVDIGADEYGKIVEVINPSSGEIWATNSKHIIKWDKYCVGSVDIQFSDDNGINWQTLAAGITDTNSFVWQLPDIDSNQCIVSVVPSEPDPNVLTEESGLFTIKWYPERPPVPLQWQRRGLLPSPNLSENKGPKIGCTKWVFETDGPVSSQAAITRPYWDSYWIYIGAEDGNLYCLDDLGWLNFICDLNTPIVGSPAVGYYWMVYAAGQNGILYAIDDYGEISWTHKTDAPIYSTPVVGYDGKIYICSEDGKMYTLDADGSELWSFEVPADCNLSGSILATPVIDKNGTVYIGGLYEPNLYAIDANNGTLKWICDFGAVEPNKGQIVAAPAIEPNGTIYQTLAGDPNLYAVDPCTGNILWSSYLRLPNDGNSSGWSSPVIGSDGTIYVSFDDPYLRAVEPNGTIKWITRLGLIGGFTLSIDRDNKIYAASDDNFVCVIDSNGNELSRFEGEGWLSFPAVAEDGTVIVSDANNIVWALTSNNCGGQTAVLHKQADVRNDKAIDLFDYAEFAKNWRQCTDPLNSNCSSYNSIYGLYSPGDTDRDGYVNIQDLSVIADEWLIFSVFE